MVMDRVKRAWKLFKEMAKEGLQLYPVATQSYPRLYEIRELSANIPVYFALIEEIGLGQHKIFKSFILSEEIVLGFLNKKTPFIKLSKYRTLLVCLPIWVYLSEKFFTDYTYRRESLKVRESEKLLKYAETTKIPQDERGKFINTIMKLLAPYNTNSILNLLDDIEKAGTVIRIPDEVRKYFEEKYK